MVKVEGYAKKRSGGGRRGGELKAEDVDPAVVSAELKVRCSRRWSSRRWRGIGLARETDAGCSGLANCGVVVDLKAVASAEGCRERAWSRWEAAGRSS